MQRLLEAINKEFEITYRDAECFVGFQINIDKKKNKIKIFQNEFTPKILKCYNFSNCSTAKIPADPGNSVIFSN